MSSLKRILNNVKEGCLEFTQFYKVNETVYDGLLLAISKSLSPNTKNKVANTFISSTAVLSPTQVSLIYSFIYLFTFFQTGFLCIQTIDCIGTDCVVHADLELPDICLSLTPSAGINDSTRSHDSICLEGIACSPG